MLRLEQSKTYFEPLTCERCGCDTNAGEAIAINKPVMIDGKIKPFVEVCPTCYKKITLFLQRR